MAIPGIVIQARMGSTRLPGKVMADLAGAPSLTRLFERLRRVQSVSAIVLATSDLPGDDEIAAFVSNAPDIKLWRGSEQNVLKRYADAARHYDLDPIVRITADCPLIEPAVIDALVHQFKGGKFDYGDNVVPRTFPHGYDAQIISRYALDAADREATQPAEREHVGPFIIARPDRFPPTHIISSGAPCGDLRITMDYEEDLALIRGIYERLYPLNPDFGLMEILALRSQEPALFEINRCREIYG